MQRFLGLLVALFMTAGVTAVASTNGTDDEYDDLNNATNWYADRCESIIQLFEEMRQDDRELAQKFCVFPYAQAAYPNHALVVSTWDNRRMIMYTPNGNNLTAKVVNSDVIPENSYWAALSNLGLYATHQNDITLCQRPLPVRTFTLADNVFNAVIDTSDKIEDYNNYNQMIFKPHQNAVRFTEQHREEKKDEMGNIILDETYYTFKLNNPSVVAKMFRGYKDDEMTPWVVKNDFFKDHFLLQFSRWKEGEPKVKATADACHIISDYYGGRPIKDTEWMASVEANERSFYAVQFEHQDGDALGAVVCIAEGEVVSSWEFHGDMQPKEYKEAQSIWFVDDEGDFISHTPEIQCVVATEKGLELYLRLFGGESVQYYVLREVGHVWMKLQVDYWIYVW